MTTILILNLVLATAVAAGMLTFLGWGIVSDHHHRTSARTRFGRRTRATALRPAYAG
jgi:hypothetical protein